MQISKPFKHNSPRGLLHMSQLKHFCCHKFVKLARLSADFFPMVHMVESRERSGNLQETK